MNHNTNQQYRQISHKDVTTFLISEDTGKVALILAYSCSLIN